MLPNESVVRVPVQSTGERRSGQGRAGRHRVHAPGRGPASADGDQPRPGRRRRRPRHGPRAMRRRPAISPTPVSSWPCRCGWARHRRSRLENSGPCGDRRFTPMFNRAASEIAQVIEAMARRPDVDPANVVALGQSVGGGSTVALAARAGRRARRHQFRGRFGRGSGQIAASPARALAGNLCRLRCDHPHAHALDLYRERPVLGAGMAATLAGPTTPPAAMRNSNAWGRTATTAIRCSRMRPRNGSRWCATSCVRRVTPCRSRARHPAARRP